MAEAQSIDATVVAVFQDMATAGCSFTDCLLAVYERGQADARGVVAAPRRKTPAIPACPHVRIVEAYHEVLHMLPGVRIEPGTKLWAKRQRDMGSMWKWVMTSTKGDGTRRASTQDEGVAWFRMYFERAAENDFVMGKTPKTRGHENWRADFDFLLTAAGFKQVMEKTS